MLGETSKGLETVSPWTLKWDKRPEGRETKNAETKKWGNLTFAISAETFAIANISFHK